MRVLDQDGYDTLTDEIAVQKTYPRSRHKRDSQAPVARASSLVYRKRVLAWDDCQLPAGSGLNLRPSTRSNLNAVAQGYGLEHLLLMSATRRLLRPAPYLLSRGLFLPYELEFADDQNNGLPEATGSSYCDTLSLMPESLTPGQKAALTRKRRAAGKKAAQTRKRRAAAKKAAATRAARKAG